MGFALTMHANYTFGNEVALLAATGALVSCYKNGECTSYVMSN